MPIVPRYNGPISSSAVAYGPGAKPSLLDTLANGRGDFFGSALGRLFYDPEQDPRAQQAGLYKAQRDKEEYETGRMRTDDEATRNFSRDSAIVSGFRTPQTPVAETEKAINYALNQALATGDPKQITPLLKAFALSMGPAGDNLMVRANSMDGAYLKAGESPSLERQDFVREDEQQADAETEQGKRAMEKYGFDTASSDRRYNTDVDAGVQRRGQDVSAGTARRGQDIGVVENRRDRAASAFTDIFKSERALQGGDGKSVTRIKRDGSGKVTERVDQTTRPNRTGRGGGGGDKPPVAGAKKAPDGNWYVNDPKRPGKYLKVG